MFKSKINNILFIFSSLILLNGCGGGSDSEDTENEQPLGIGKSQWSYDVGSSTYIYYSSPALSADQQTIYIGTSKKVRDNSSLNDRLIAINSSGELKWEYALPNGEEVRSTPVVHDNKIYFIADRKTGEFSKSYSELFCLNEDGSLLWQRLISENSMMNSTGVSKVVVVDDKVVSVMSHINVYNANSGEQLFNTAVCSECEEQNRLEPDQYINPIINSLNEVVFFANGKYQRLDLSNYSMEEVTLTSLEGNDQVTSTPALDSNGNIYFGTEGADVVAIDSSGHQLWRYTINKPSLHHAPYFRSSPVIDEANGSIYIGTKNNGDSKFIALDISSGQLKWEFDVSGDIYSSPLIGDNGNIYFASETNYLYALNKNGELSWKENLGGDVTWSSPTIDNQGMLYIGTMGNGSGNGKLIKIKTGSSGLSTGIWSKIHANQQNTGSHL